MESRRIKEVRKYLKANGRVDKELAKISKLFKEKPMHPGLTLFVMKKMGADQGFKFLILLHVLIHDQAIDLDLCAYLLQEVSFKLDSSFDQFISQKYLNDYKLYLQKRCPIDLSRVGQTAEEKELAVYSLINLLKMVSSFEQIIYTIGRYYPDQFRHVIDFNIILAKDMRQVYQTITANLTKPHNPDILQEIQAAHEVMYPVFYNNYYYQFITDYCPKWLFSYASPTTAKKSKSKSRDESTIDSDIQRFLSSTCEKKEEQIEVSDFPVISEFPGQEQEDIEKQQAIIQA